MTRSMMAAAAGILALAACEEIVVADAPTIDDGLPSPARAACMSAVADQAGDGNLAVLSGVASRSRTEYVLGVGEDRVQWRCVAGSDGVVQEVSPMADQGTL